MKKFYTLLLLAALGHAQVPNHGFEQSLDSGTLKNWGAFYPIPVTFDPQTGQSTSDQIFFDNGIGFSFGIADCWTGTSAMYVSNAFNMTQNKAIPGFARLFDDTNSPTATGWNYGVPIPAGTPVQIFGFDYKFSPVGDDIGLAWIEVYDADGQSVGRAEINMTQPVWDFQYVYTPIDFTSTATPVFMQIGFEFRNENADVNWGSHMIIDNVLINWTSLGNQPINKRVVSVFPTLVDSELNVLVNDGISGNHELTIIDTNGRIIRKQENTLTDSAVTLDVSGLEKGIYILKVAGQQNHTTRFIKK